MLLLFLYHLKQLVIVDSDTVTVFRLINAHRHDKQEPYFSLPNLRSDSYAGTDLNLIAMDTQIIQ